MKRFNDGKHRLDIVYPESSYQHYSQTSSGWTITTNPKAVPAKRWRITHPMYGERYFVEHDDILKWTLEHMREQYKKTPERFTLRPGIDLKKEIEAMEAINAKYAKTRGKR